MKAWLQRKRPQVSLDAEALQRGDGLRLEAVAGFVGDGAGEDRPAGHCCSQAAISCEASGAACVSNAAEASSSPSGVSAAKL